MLVDALGLLLSHPHGLPTVQVTEAALLEMLVHLGGDEAGEQFLGELVMLDLAVALLVMLEHAHRLEPDRTGQHLVREAPVLLAAAVDLAMRGLCVIIPEKSHGGQNSWHRPGLSNLEARAVVRQLFTLSCERMAVNATGSF